ncbi:MAG: hypothetical protein HY735_12665 [Verrucomicrobia bacterium]|nr:hypothetical protein [Verrucomicrobiota bacterium]
MTRILYPPSIRRFLTFLALFCATLQSGVQASTQFVRVGELARDFTLKDRKTGQIVSLSDFAGKVIFLDLFAYW